VVRDLGDLGDEMTGDQDGPALRAEFPDEAAQPADSLRIQAVAGLVEEQYRRVAE
jgi:hypothetical protein